MSEHLADLTLVALDQGSMEITILHTAPKFGELWDYLSPSPAVKIPIFYEH
jgi:hypothetical protein